MKNKADLSLYKQVLKQLLLPAIIMGAVCIVSSILNMSVLAEPSIRFEYVPLFRRTIFKFYAGRPIAAAIAPALIVFMYIGPAVFTYMAFRHLNNRSSSDFYGAMPHSSLTVYLSRIAAVFTWQFAIIILTMCASVITMIGSQISFDWSFVPKLTLSFMAGSILIVGGISIAMSITGNAVANSIAAFVILVLPRFMLFVFDRLILGATWDLFADISKMGIFLNPVYNIPTALILDITQMWQYYGLSETLIHTGAILYTLILGVIYLGIGMWLMRRRKSELAGKGTLNKLLAHILSAAASLPLLAYAIFSLTAHGTFVLNRTSFLKTFVIFWLVAFLVFTISEFIMRRSIKTALLSIPVFVATFILSFGLLYAQKEIGVMINSRVPDIDKIEYIKIDENREVVYKYKPIYSYRKLMTKDVEFDNPELIAMLQQTLARNVEETERRRQDGNLYFTREGEAYFEFKLKNGKSIYRNMALYEDTLEDIRDLLADNCEYKHLVYTLPPMEDVQATSIYMQDQIYEGFGYDIYTSYLSEYEELDFGGKSDVVYTNDYGNIFNISGNGIYSFYPDKATLQNFTVYGKMKGYNWQSSYIISDLFPETARLYIKEINRIRSPLFLEDVEKITTATDLPSNLRVDIELLNSVNDALSHPQRYAMHYNVGVDRSDYLDFDKLKEIFGYIGAENLRDVSFDSPMIYININYSDNDLSNYTSYQVYVKVTQEQFDELYMIFINNLNN